VRHQFEDLIGLPRFLRPRRILFIWRTAA